MSITRDSLSFSRVLPITYRHVHERRFDLAGEASSPKLLCCHDLRPASRERLETFVVGARVLAQLAGQYLDWLLSRMIFPTMLSFWLLPYGDDAKSNVIMPSVRLESKPKGRSAGPSLISPAPAAAYPGHAAI